jgi:hypothetical protein
MLSLKMALGHCWRVFWSCGGIQKGEWSSVSRREGSRAGGDERERALSMLKSRKWKEWTVKHREDIGVVMER